MGSALVENALIPAIVSCLSDADGILGPLFHDEKGPFGSFYARILAGRALSLFDADVAKDLDIIRDIRNQFAHALLKLDFEHPLIAAECKRLTERDKWQLPKREVSAARIQYENACLSLTVILQRATTRNLTQRIREANLHRNALSSLNERIAPGLESGPDNVLGNVLPDKT